MTLNEQAAERLRELTSRPNLATTDTLQAVLFWAAKWRARMLANTLIAEHGAVILSGPFEGMRYVSRPPAGSLAPRLLGCYESELHETLEALIEDAPEAVIDIGCAEGYYAIGLARRLPGVPVHAHDIQPWARKACEVMAAANGVAGQLHLGAEFRGEDFAAFVGRKVLLIVDIEGAEDELLRPDRYPALRGMTIVVETHDGARPGVAARLTERFESSHAVTRIEEGDKGAKLPEWLGKLSHLDRLLAVWEYRTTPTPWLVMRPRSAAAAPPPPSQA